LGAKKKFLGARRTRRRKRKKRKEKLIGFGL
jgi:hypothetical protein